MMKATDILQLRDSGPWAREKLYYVERYMSIFNRGMKHHWPQRGYADLMAGPGGCIDRTTDEEFAGSPVLALKSQPPFGRAVFVESNPRYAESLINLTEADAGRRWVLQADCNAPATISEIRRLIGPDMLTPQHR
jgi:three-Cys-motif partner protein